MRMPHVLRVEQEATSFAELVRAAAEEGLRVGWLVWGSEPEPPAELAGPAELGVARAAKVGPSRTVGLKTRRGPPVLRDVVREHFLGCAVLLVRGPIEAARLRRDGDRWRYEPLSGPARSWTLEKLLGALRRPRLPGRDPVS